MEFKWLVILMAILYILPEILKKRRPKKYEYPEIPQPVPQPAPETIPEISLAQEPAWIQSKAAAKETQTPSYIAPPIELVNLSETEGVQQVNLSQAMVVNGFIFAEILQPPRALRPLAERRLGGR